MPWRCRYLADRRNPITNIDLIKILGVSEWSPTSMPDFFRSCRDSMIDLRHPLAALATRMSWASIDAALAAIFLPVLLRRMEMKTVTAAEFATATFDGLISVRRQAAP